MIEYDYQLPHNFIPAPPFLGENSLCETTDFLHFVLLVCLLSAAALYGCQSPSTAPSAPIASQAAMPILDETGGEVFVSEAVTT